MEKYVEKWDDFYHRGRRCQPKNTVRAPCFFAFEQKTNYSTSLGTQNSQGPGHESAEFWVAGEFCSLKLEQFRQPHTEFSFQIEIYKFHNGGLKGLTDKLHSGLSGRSATLFDVAGSAARNNVGPFVVAALHLGNDMIYGEISRGELATAVLAHERVSGQNIFSGKRNFSPIDLADKLHQAYHCRDPECSSNSSDDPSGFFDDLNFSTEQESHSALP
jgi:hypothetical protein